MVLKSLNPGTVTGLTIITTLPVGYRPERNVLIQLADSTGRTNGAIMYLNQNGNLYLANDSSFTTALNYSAQAQFYAS